ncbi:MFS transporter [Sphaerobacter sp.]|uniref:MFS transporter n=1 Tax=Sphaerobacter sp. TaxID=2099654 RepID=UPI001D72BDA0|nr:MFS transporter [Sphaerobacter sp.]MBX5446255.1 MFS transporter [Sphaerobacter sp.]
MSSQIAHPADSRAGTALLLISAGHFMSHFWLITWPSLFTVLAGVFQVDYLQLGFLMTLYSVTSAIFQVPFGYLADRHGPKPILVFGLLVNGAAIGLSALAPNYGVLLVLALCAGVGQAVFHPADYAILSALFSAERAGKPYSLHTFTGFAGSAAAPLVIAGITAVFNWQVALAVAGLLGIIIAAAVAFQLRVPAPVRPAPSPKAEGASRKGASFSFMLSRPFLLLFGFFVFTSMFTAGLQSFLPSTLTERYGVSLETANGMLTAFLVTLAIGVLAGGVLADRIRSYGRVIAASFTASTLLMLLVAAVPIPVWLLLPVFALAGGLQGIIMPSRDKLVRESSPEGAAGQSFAFVSVGFSVGGIIAPPILGGVLNRGEPMLVFWCLALFLVLATVTVLIPARQPAKDRARTEERASV